MRGIYRSPVNSPHKGQWRRAFVFSFICAWINASVNNREAGDLRRHRVYYDVIVMGKENVRMRETQTHTQTDTDKEREMVYQYMYSIFRSLVDCSILCLSYTWCRSVIFGVTMPYDNITVESGSNNCKLLGETNCGLMNCAWRVTNGMTISLMSLNTSVLYVPTNIETKCRVKHGVKKQGVMLTESVRWTWWDVSDCDNAIYNKIVLLERYLCWSMTN